METNVFCSARCQINFGTTQRRFQKFPGVLFPGVKGPGLEADHSSPCGAEFKNTSRCATCLQGTVLN